MALVIKDRVKETTTTTGTGAVSLAGAESNFVTFSSVLSDGDTTYYGIVDSNNTAFEVGLGTYASSGNTLTRTTVFASSNSGSAVDLQAGSKIVFCAYPSEKAVFEDATGKVTIDGNVGIESGLIDLKNAGAVSKIKFYCEFNNAHAQTVQGAPHSEAASNTLTLPSAGSNLVSDSATQTLTNKTLTSPKINEDVAVSATATELNILDGVTASTAELNILDGVTASTAELNYLDITTLGSSQASKAVTADANAKVTFIGATSVAEMIEKVTIDSSTTGTINFDFVTQAVQFFNVDQTANRTINFRGDGSTTLNSLMAIGESMTAAIVMKQGSSAYYLNTYQVDGTGVTPEWSGGSAPSAGNASSLDSYTFSIIKTADATFTVMASQIQFA
jgi:hypothetical protein